MASVRILAALTLLLSPCSGLRAQPSSASLTIQAVDKPALILTEDSLAKLPHQTATVKEHGKEVAYSGVNLHDLLVQAGAPSGSELHGRILSSYVLATARDGYQAVFTLTEMDPSVSDDVVLVADHADGSPLPETQGPFRIVAVHDKKPVRSVRMLQKIEVVQLRH